MSRWLCVTRGHRSTDGEMVGGGGHATGGDAQMARAEGGAAARLHVVRRDTVFELEVPQVVVDVLRVVVAQLRVALAERVEVELVGFDRHGLLATAGLLLLELLLLKLLLPLAGRPLSGDPHVGRLRHRRDARPRTLPYPHQHQ